MAPCGQRHVHCGDGHTIVWCFLNHSPRAVRACACRLWWSLTRMPTSLSESLTPPVFASQTPGRTQGVWGWNDTSALYCGACGKLAADHIVLAAPVFEPIRKPAPPAAANRHAAPVSARHNLFSHQSASPPACPGARRLVHRCLVTRLAHRCDRQVLDQNQLQSARAYQAERAALAKTELQMLDDSVDPLSIGARGDIRGKGAGKRDPPTIAAPVAASDALLAALSATAATATTAPKVSDDVAALLAREKAYSDSFKDEVERMVRESIAAERRKQLDQELDARLPVQPAAGGHGRAAQEQERHDSVGALLQAAGLPQYVGAFEAEAMDAETLYGVMEAQGYVAAVAGARGECGMRIHSSNRRAEPGGRCRGCFGTPRRALRQRGCDVPPVWRLRTGGGGEQQFTSSAFYPLVCWTQACRARGGAQGARRQL